MLINICVLFTMCLNATKNNNTLLPSFFAHFINLCQVETIWTSHFFLQLFHLYAPSRRLFCLDGKSMATKSKWKGRWKKSKTIMSHAIWDNRFGIKPFIKCIWKYLNIFNCVQHKINSTATLASTATKSVEWKKKYETNTKKKQQHCDEKVNRDNDTDLSKNVFGANRVN